MDSSRTCLPPQGLWEGYGLNAGEGVSEIVEGIEEALGAGANDGHDSFLSVCAGVGSVSTPDFSVDDRGTNRLFRPPVGGVRLGVAKEREYRIDMFIDEFRKAFLFGLNADGEDEFEE